MSDPVDTGALRKLAGQMRSVAGGDRALGIELAGKMHDYLAEQFDSAADEVDRLRAVIENAPHAPGCAAGHVVATVGSCTCWKVDIR